MRATGVVRRIDDLCRVVIPKEIRRTLRISVVNRHIQHYHFSTGFALWYIVLQKEQQRSDLF